MNVFMYVCMYCICVCVYVQYACLSFDFLDNLSSGSTSYLAGVLLKTQGSTQKLFGWMDGWMVLQKAPSSSDTGGHAVRLFRFVTLRTGSKFN